MTMAIVLEFTQTWLRDIYGWNANECSVQYQALPALDAPSFSVTIDDAGIETGPDTTDSLKEITILDVGIWKRPEHLSIKDRRGKLKLPKDRYVITATMLNDLERNVIKALHANYDYLVAINQEYELPNSELGSDFYRPLFYRGRSRMEVLGLEDETSTQSWFGYRLRFKGLEREHKLRSS